MKKCVLLLLAAASLVLAGCHEEWDGAADELESVSTTTAKKVTAEVRTDSADEVSDDSEGEVMAESYEDSYTAAFCEKLAGRDFRIETEEYRLHSTDSEAAEKAAENNAANGMVHTEELEWKAKKITQVCGDDVYLYNDGGQRDDSGTPFVEQQYFFGDEAYSMVNDEVLILGDNEYTADDGVGRLEMRIFSQEPEKLEFVSSVANGNTVTETFVIKVLEGEDLMRIEYDRDSGELQGVWTSKSCLLVDDFKENTGEIEIPDKVKDFKP